MTMRLFGRGYAKALMVASLVLAIAPLSGRASSGTHIRVTSFPEHTVSGCAESRIAGIDPLEPALECGPSIYGITEGGANTNQSGADDGSFWLQDFASGGSALEWYRARSRIEYVVPYTLSHPARTVEVRTNLVINAAEIKGAPNSFGGESTISGDLISQAAGATSSNGALESPPCDGGGSLVQTELEPSLHFSGLLEARRYTVHSLYSCPAGQLIVAGTRFVVRLAVEGLATATSSSDDRNVLLDGQLVDVEWEIQ